VWRLAVKVIPPGDTRTDNVYCGAWRLAVRVPRQAVWKLVAPSELRTTPGDMSVAELCLCASDVHDLQGFDDIPKVGLPVFLESWLETYPLSCGSG